MARALDAIGDGWSLLIVRDAFDGLRRFGDFQKNLGIAKGMLERAPAQAGGARRARAGSGLDGSAYQEYALTRKGRDLFPVVVSLRQWGEAHLYARGESAFRPVDEQGQPVGQAGAAVANRPAADVVGHQR